MLQTILLRESYQLFMGNSLSTGVFFSIWLLFTGLGAIIGNKVKFTNRLLIILIIAITILTSFAEIIFFLITSLFYSSGFSQAIELPSYQLYVPGFISIVESLIFSAGIISFFYGMFFSAISQIADTGRKKYIYISETVGAFAGGLIFTFVLSDLLFNTYILALISVLLVIVFVLLNLSTKKVTLIISVCLVVFISTSGFLINLREHNFGINNISLIPTKYGLINIYHSDYSNIIYLNHEIIAQQENHAGKEYSIHIPLAQRKNIKKVLLIGGGLDGAIEEVQKYNPEIIYYVYENMNVIELSQKYLGLEIKENVKLIKNVRDAGNDLDAVIVNVGGFDNPGKARFYSSEYLEFYKMKLADGGIVSLKLPLIGSYAWGKTEKLSSIIFSTARKSFSNVLVVPEHSMFIMASDSTLSLDYRDLFQNHNITTLYANSDYTDDFSLKFKSDEITGLITENFGTNSINKPGLSGWIFRFILEKQGGWQIFIVISIAWIGLFLFTKPCKSSLSVAVSGFASISLEMMMFYAFQIINGSIFLAPAVLSSVFMLGLTVSVYGSRLVSYKYLILLLIITILFPIYLSADNFQINTVIANIIIISSNFSIAFLNGSIFKKSLIGRENKIGRLYGFDLLGSVPGGIVAFNILLPVFGFIETLAFSGLLMLSGLYLIKKN